MSCAAFFVGMMTIALRGRSTATTCSFAAMVHLRVLPRAWVLSQALLLALFACVAAMARAPNPLTASLSRTSVQIED